MAPRAGTEGPRGRRQQGKRPAGGAVAEPGLPRAPREAGQRRPHLHKRPLSQAAGAAAASLAALQSLEQEWRGRNSGLFRRLSPFTAGCPQGSPLSLHTRLGLTSHPSKACLPSSGKQSLSFLFSEPPLGTEPLRLRKPLLKFNGTITSHVVDEALPYLLPGDNAGKAPYTA